jgi:capsule polysaccharide modification protein KpsS
LSSSQLLIDFTFRTKLHHRIAIAAHCYFSSVSHFAPNYIITSPSLVTAIIFIGLSLRTELHHRIAIAAHCYFSSVSHFTPNYIIAIAAHS